LTAIYYSENISSVEGFVRQSFFHDFLAETQLFGVQKSRIGIQQKINDQDALRAPRIGKYAIN
jgi:hypothetical protein